MPSATQANSLKTATAPRLPAAPVVRELDGSLTPQVVAHRLSCMPQLLVMESTMRHEHLGRFSFVAADPVRAQSVTAERADEILSWLDESLNQYRVDAHQNLPPFQGGIAGLFDYEFNRVAEPSLSKARHANSDSVVAALALYDVVLAWDHLQDRAWLISQGFPETDLAKRKTVAERRADEFESLLAGVQENPQEMESTTSLPTEPTSDFQRDDYLSMLEQAVEFIRSGDVFQVNLAQQLSYPAYGSSLKLFDRLRDCNASTFAAYLDLGDRQIISASPERLLAVRDRHVETRPIKGTRRRTRHPEVDIDVGNELLASDKDRAENVMIVDLMRNDLSRICTDDSVRVTQFVELESYASVLHLVSAIEGELRDQVMPSDLLKAVFPGGSITGAPKVRAMEIIDELEKSPRGAYCGSIGYFGFDGTVDLNILIRTITAQRGTWTFPVGGGITINSNASMEFDETLTKAKGLLDAMWLRKANR